MEKIRLSALGPLRHDHWALFPARGLHPSSPEERCCHRDHVRGTGAMNLKSGIAEHQLRADRRFPLPPSPLRFARSAPGCWPVWIERATNVRTSEYFANLPATTLQAEGVHRCLSRLTGHGLFVQRPVSRWYTPASTSHRFTFVKRVRPNSPTDLSLLPGAEMSEQKVRIPLDTLDERSPFLFRFRLIDLIVDVCIGTYN